MSKMTLCVDFDGVIHSYVTPWQGTTIIPDPPTEGALEFLRTATNHFKVAIFSSRSAHPDGILCMQRWLETQIAREYNLAYMPIWYRDLSWPNVKPSAHLYIDDRAWLFTGKWPSMDELLKFKPWNKQGVPTNVPN